MDSRRLKSLPIVPGQPRSTLACCLSLDSLDEIAAVRSNQYAFVEAYVLAAIVLSGISKGYYPQLPLFHYRFVAPSRALV